ncbi:hypothetical protein TG4357_03742 [Thalassovita gelatinovora]|uniref:Uncharacterized protein n=1 Tax=Thalassovita gelatinovora TaxID=53501 RepID=A0A0P1FLF1_THAGE|nr:hypothetical protein [Thalassovita gelatinovora]QIZ79076.1 hypothetical protein HFZ77_00585 [Thalassovita gelatinovora]CUH68695.1 hypothetical protein TG4357_03742 [Thalassovita gelatinovora]SEQ56821.1 hypothetical protein SAMN04488043_106203 [Thalassovita gelatinovora]
MISSVDVKSAAGAVVTTLRLSTKAMVRLERENGIPIHQVLQKLDKEGSVDLVAGIFAAAMNDGKGGAEDDAYDAIDEVGGTVDAVVFVGEAIGLAFPAAEKTDDDVVALEEPVGNGKGKKPSK